MKSNPIPPDVRPVDIAILYGLGQKDRAQALARRKHSMWRVSGDVSESELRRVRERFESDGGRQ